MIRVSSRLNKLRPSPTLGIAAKAKELKSKGQDIVNLSAGEPDFDTPDFIKDAAIAAITKSFTKYTPTTGTPELKKLISQKFKTENSLNYHPSQIVVSNGAKHSIYNAIFALLNKDEEVIIPCPYWVSYPEMVNMCEGVARFIDTKAEDNFKLTAYDLRRNLTDKTKLIILNSPSNPCGSVYHIEELKEIAKICVERKIFCLADEIYEKIIYAGLRHLSIASLGEEIYNLTITVNGLSKSHAMTGWRIGYLGAPLEIAEAIGKIQDHSTSNPCSISQKAAEAALAGDDAFPKKMCLEFQRRRDYCLERLSQMSKIKFIKPEGAFYIFCNIAETGLSSLEITQRLLEEASLAVVPGEAFGRPEYIRISFTASLQDLEKGMDNLESWLKKI